MLGVPSTWRASLLWCLLAALTAAGCGRRHPFDVSRARHPEYYSGLADQPPPRVELRARQREAEPARGSERRPRERSREFVPPQLADLPGESREVAPGIGDGAGERLDLAGGRLSGAVSVEVNDPIFQERLDLVFDGDTSTPARSEGVNPLVFRITLDPPVQLLGVRVFPSYATYDWTVRAHPEQPRLLVRGAADEQWSGVDLPEPVATGEVQIEIARLVRDDHVHVNEIELFVAE